MKNHGLLLAASLVLTTVNCGPGASTAEEAAEPVEAVDPTPSQSSVIEAPPGELPEGVPDRNEDPAGFYTWRVDNMFITRDVDQDGYITRDEFNGDPLEYDKMDADGDGQLAKQEVHDHVFSRFVVPQADAE